MAQPSQLLQALLGSLAQARQGTTLVLDAGSLGGTAAASLLQLFSDQLQRTSLTLDAVVLPASVVGDTLAISGTSGGVAIGVSFQDARGALASQLLLQAAAIAPLRTLVPALGKDFFAGIAISGAAASVTVPGLAVPLAFSAPTYGVVGLVSPSSGLVTTSIAPRVDGQVSPPSGAKGLFVEVATPTSGFRIAPLSGAWSFADFGWLLTGLDILGAFPAIIPTHGLGLSSFDLELYPAAPAFSSLSLDVADLANPAQPLWSAIGGKVQLTDVVVTLGLTYSQTHVLSLTGTGSVQGNFLLGTLALEAEIPFPLTGVWSLTAYPNLSLTVLDDLGSLLDGGSGQLDGLLPANLSALGNFELTYLRIAVDAAAFSLVELSFAVGSSAPWRLIPDVVELASLQIRMTIDGTPAASGSVIGTIRLADESDLTVSFGRTTPQLPWRLDAISPLIVLPGLGDLATLAQGTNLGALVQAGGLDQLRFVMTNVNFGMTIAPAQLTNLGLTLQLASSASLRSPALDWELIPGVLTLTGFAFGFQLAWGAAPSTRVYGSFVLNGLDFDVTFAEQARQGASTDALIAEYSAPAGAGTVDVKQLIHSISPSVAAGVPEGLVIDLADALLAYLGTGPTKKYVFAMDIAVELPLSDLPLVGKALPADAKVGLKNLKVVVASAALTADEVAFVNGLSRVPVLPLPAAGATGAAIPAGFSMIAELELGSLSILMTSPPVNQPGPAQGAGLAMVAAGAPARDPVMWIDVQKTFGPVAIQKVGFSYHDSSLFVVSNLALTVGGLEIDLLGIGVGSPIAHPTPKFTIEGLAVSFSEGPISVMGGMLGTLEPLDFTGALSVRAPEIALAAFAGYAEYQDHPSFFLYGVLDLPLGGPPPFFVTGVAAGLGFNRKLVIPDVSGVAKFPLVAWATGDGTPSMDPTKPIGAQVGAVLAQLAQSGVVAPSVGDYWFAAGIRFTSFELIESFALVTVSLGTDVEIALLGLSTLTLPPDDPVPVAEVQIALEVSFSYSTGLLAVAGQLTPNSYVLSRDCRLTGGFAFYLWFTGPHAGETVLTLGGYNPSFTVPSYYPVVPRLGLSWQIGGDLSITGGLYFALTSNVVMAGGKLSAVWSSGPIRAWFTYWADFLMQFSPFHYYIDGGIDLGASFTVHLLFFSVSMTIHIGVGIELWGPPFTGKATVDLSIISFTISFGAQSRQTDTSIPWSTFVGQLLPAQPAPGARAVRRGRPLLVEDPPPPAPPAAVVQINLTDGLIRTLPPLASGPCYLVNAETFACAVLTVIPSKQVSFAGHVALAPDDEQPHDDHGGLIPPAQDFGAGPANVAPGAFVPVLALGLATAATSTLHAVRRLTSAPKALWENKQFDAHGVPVVDPSAGLAQTTIPNALVGFTLVPYTGDVDYTRAVPLQSLLFTLDDSIQRFAWSPGVPPASDPFTDQTVAGTITAPAVAAVRGALLGALAAQGVTVATTVDVARLADPADDDLQAAPRLRLLGEQAA